MEILNNKLKKSYLAKALLIYNYFIENTYSNFEEKKCIFGAKNALRRWIFNWENACFAATKNHVGCKIRRAAPCS